MRRYILLFYFFPLVQNTPQNKEQKLISKIFTNHSPDARPVENTTTPIKVKFGIELVQLVSIDERSQSMTTKLWVRQIWVNAHIHWKPREWGGVDRLNVNAAYVWKPDIVLYNDAGEDFAGGTDKFKTLINLFPDGVNAWLSPATFRSTCKIDVRYFPFDIQKCTLKFGSWALDATKVDLAKEGSPLITKQYLNSSEWDIVDVAVAIHKIIYRCCPEPYTDLTFTLILKRRPLYYVINIIAPCIVLVMMVLFNFLLPPESGERLGLNITVMLALAVFLQFLSNSLPRNSDSTPILSLFFIILMSESALALIATVLVLSFHHRGEDHNASSPPNWMRKIFLGIDSDSNTMLFRKTTLELCSALKLLHQYEIAIDDGSRHKSEELLKLMEENYRTTSANHDDIIVYSLQDILKEMSKMNTVKQGQYKREDIEEEWKQLAKALDRFFFWVFLLAMILSSVITLLVIYRQKDY